MFDINISELMVIGSVALIVIGPNKLPKIAKTLGYFMGRAQRYLHSIKSDIEREVELDEIRELKIEINNVTTNIKKDIVDEIEKLDDETRKKTFNT
ncbi:MAG: twin-arginine translocase subunit TatB [Bordetella sp.]|nr:MAG: twin-arginine translocase subunit TatB [Bordetella sp.]